MIDITAAVWEEKYREAVTRERECVCATISRELYVVCIVALYSCSYLFARDVQILRSSSCVFYSPLQGG